MCVCRENRTVTLTTRKLNRTYQTYESPETRQYAHGKHLEYQHHRPARIAAKDFVLPGDQLGIQHRLAFKAT